MSIVASDKIIFQIEKTIGDAIEMGVDEFFINDLRQYPDVDGACKVRPFWTLPIDQVRRGKDMLESAIHSARSAGVIAELTPRLSQNIDDAINRSGTIRGNDEDSCQPAVGPYSASPGEGETRFCTDPWDSGVFNADGDVSPCCLFPVIYGNVHKYAIDEIFENDKAINLRKQLLTGKLATQCASCNLRAITTTRHLTEAISSRLVMNTDKSLASIINPLIPEWKGKRVIVYGAGGHTKQLFDETRIADAHPIGIVDKNAHGIGPSIYGTPLYSTSSIDSLKPDVIVISSFIYQEEIYQEIEHLSDRGIEIKKIYA